MAKRARRLDLDTNAISVSGLEIIRKVLENELAQAETKQRKLQLIFWTTQLKYEIKERSAGK